MRTKQLEKVNDARDLLDMLEYVLGSGSASTEAATQFPLGGIRLTVLHISRHLSELERMIREGSPENTKAAHPKAGGEQREPVPEKVANGSIASRIQMAPVPRANRRGYTREISPETFTDTDPQDVPSAE